MKDGSNAGTPRPPVGMEPGRIPVPVGTKPGMTPVPVGIRTDKMSEPVGTRPDGRIPAPSSDEACAKPAAPVEPSIGTIDGKVSLPEVASFELATEEPPVVVPDSPAFPDVALAVSSPVMEAPLAVDAGAFDVLADPPSLDVPKLLDDSPEALPAELEVWGPDALFVVAGDVMEALADRSEADELVFVALVAWVEAGKLIDDSDLATEVEVVAGGVSDTLAELG